MFALLLKSRAGMWRGIAAGRGNRAAFDAAEFAEIRAVLAGSPGTLAAARPALVKAITVGSVDVLATLQLRRNSFSARSVSDGLRHELTGCKKSEGV